MCQKYGEIHQIEIQSPKFNLSIRLQMIFFEIFFFFGIAFTLCVD